MRFENTTNYGKEALAALNLAASKTVQRRRFLFRRIFLFVVGVLGVGSGLILLLIFDSLEFVEQVIGIMSLLVGVVMLAEGILIRRLAVRRSRRMLVKGIKQSILCFEEATLNTENPGVERSSYEYSAFSTICETTNFYVLLLDAHHGMMIDKSGFTQGDPKDFPTFLQEKTGKKLQYIK